MSTATLARNASQRERLTGQHGTITGEPLRACLTGTPSPATRCRRRFARRRTTTGASGSRSPDRLRELRVHCGRRRARPSSTPTCRVHCKRWTPPLDRQTIAHGVASIDGARADVRHLRAARRREGDRYPPARDGPAERGPFTTPERPQPSLGDPRPWRSRSSTSSVLMRDLYRRMMTTAADPEQRRQPHDELSRATPKLAHIRRMVHAVTVRGFTATDEPHGRLRGRSYPMARERARFPLEPDLTRWRWTSTDAARHAAPAAPSTRSRARPRRARLRLVFVQVLPIGDSSWLTSYVTRLRPPRVARSRETSAPTRSRISAKARPARLALASGLRAGMTLARATHV